MCGIAGWFGKGIACDEKSLVAALRHRGPDGAGVWRDPKDRAGLVHTRLAIIDLSAAGAQPMGLGEHGAGSMGRPSRGQRSEIGDQQDSKEQAGQTGKAESRKQKSEEQVGREQGYGNMEHGAWSVEQGAGSRGQGASQPPSLLTSKQRSPASGQEDSKEQEHSSVQASTPPSKETGTDQTSEVGGQSGAQSRYWIVFNGEIYNYRELREELDDRDQKSEIRSRRETSGSGEEGGQTGKAESRKQKSEEQVRGEQGYGSREQGYGSREQGAGSEEPEAEQIGNSQSEIRNVQYGWKSNTDTEALLRLLIREGKAALPKLAGMFAFAFYDSESGRALLARDAFGIKPLYYLERDGGLAFASEMRALRSLLPETETAAGALRDTLLWGSVAEPATLVNGIRQLPAGCFIEWDGAVANVGRWHRLRFDAAPAPSDSVTATRAALIESIRRHLVSDVPVGIFLSGGIDSTAVLALAREVLGRGADLRTFSIGFDDPAYDESVIARRTAEHFGARHTEWHMTPEEGRAEIAGYLAAMDQPTIDGFNTWCVSKLARREGMKVVLSGLGGDELFGGYGSFRLVPLFLRLHRWLGPLRVFFAGVLGRTPAGSRWRRFAAFLRGPGTILSAFHAQRGIFTEPEARVLARLLTGRDADPADWLLEDLPDDPADAVSFLELTRYMRNQLLRDSDIFSMAHGLELRVPFVDGRLFKALADIPASVRLRRGKRLLLDAVPEIPKWVRKQPKRGFRFPFEEWMKGKFGDVLAAADKKSTVPLVTWYRRWALAAVLLKS